MALKNCSGNSAAPKASMPNRTPALARQCRQRATLPAARKASALMRHKAREHDGLVLAVITSRHSAKVASRCWSIVTKNGQLHATHRVTLGASTTRYVIVIISICICITFHHRAKKFESVSIFRGMRNSAHGKEQQHAACAANRLGARLGFEVQQNKPSNDPPPETETLSSSKQQQLQQGKHLTGSPGDCTAHCSTHNGRKLLRDIQRGTS